MPGLPPSPGLRRSAVASARRRKGPAYGCGLLRKAVEDIDEFAQTLANFGFTFRHAFGHAVLDMVTEDAEADAVQSGFGSGELLQNLDTQPGLLHHPPNPADLPLDSVQSCHESLLFGPIQHQFLFVRSMRRTARGHKG